MRPQALGFAVQPSGIYSRISATSFNLCLKGSQFHLPHWKSEFMKKAQKTQKLPHPHKATGTRARGVHFSSRKTPFPQQERKCWPKYFVKNEEKQQSPQGFVVLPFCFISVDLPIKLRAMILPSQHQELKCYEVQSWDIVFGAGCWEFIKLLIRTIFGLPWSLNRNPESSGQNWGEDWKREVHGQKIPVLHWLRMSPSSRDWYLDRLPTSRPRLHRLAACSHHDRW